MPARRMERKQAALACLTAGLALLVVGMAGPAVADRVLDEPPGKAKAWGERHSTRANGKSANLTGRYDPNGVGLPSGNGSRNGDGGTTGKPCAGCVGKADGKNPPGQVRHDESGHDDNGYECDGNRGIGRTNPAHSGCDDSTTTTTSLGQTTTTTAPTTTTTAPTTTSTTVATTTSTAAPTTTTLAPSTTTEPTVAAQVLGVQFTRDAALPATGGPLTGVATAGLVLAGIGLLLLTVRRESAV